MMKRRLLSRSTTAAVLGLLCLATVGFAGQWAADGQGAVNLTEYYPLQDSNTWTYQVKEYRADGQVFYRLKTQTVKGESELSGGIRAKRLVDDHGSYVLVSVDANRLVIYGQDEGRGVVTYTPPYTVLNVAYEPGKAYRIPHVPSAGQPVFSEATFYGFESIEVPAGAFKDCLKMRFQFMKPSGATHTITSFLAKGVGVVKQIKEISSPAANQTLRSEIELLHGTVNKKKIGGEAAQTVNIAEYFPFHQSDLWTYDWEFRLADGTVKKFERTRRFEGTRFFDAGAAFKMVDNTGKEYQYYMLDKKTGLRIVASGERGTRAKMVEFNFDPPMLLGRDDMVLGRQYRYSEDTGGHLVHFTTVMDGFQPVTTPMGQFDKCLRVNVNWESDATSVRSTYYLARGLGIVAYDYQAYRQENRHLVIASHGELKHAVVDNHEVASAKDAADLWDRMMAELRAAEEDPEARRLFRAASLNRYVWDKDLGFRGFEADFTISIDGGPAAKGHMRCDPNLRVSIDLPDAQARVQAHTEWSQFVTHRQPRKPFDDWYGPDKAKFKLGEKTPEGQQVRVVGGAMGSSYILGNKMVKYLSRNVGRFHFTIHNEKQIFAEDGRYIATEYGVTYYKKGTNQVVGTDHFVDRYVKKGPYWVPAGRIHISTMPGMPHRIDMEVTNLEYLK